jgi:hypothetical protein
MSEATFTISLREAFEISGGERTLGSNGISVLTGGDIGLNYYELWDANYRGTLNGKIYDHYFLREIGAETLEIFQWNMRSRMNEIMPYYNELYKTKLNLIDPLRTIDMQTVTNATGSQDVDANSETEATAANKSGSRSISSDFPQNMLSGSSDYASAGADINGTTSVESTGKEKTGSESNSESHSDASVTGYQGSPGDIINAYRQAILNIDLMIINDLELMFMQVFNNGDSYFPMRGYLL